MRTHRDIIGKQVTAFAHQIGVDPNTVKQWKRNDSIPAPHWNAVAREGLATLQELASAAEARRREQAAA